MKHLFRFSFLVLAQAAVSASGVDFQREIQPIFAEHCYECHGPDAQKGGLNLTSRAGAVKVLESGMAAIVAGHPEKSEAIARMTTDDDEEIMPPKKKAKRPTTQQIDLLRKWIAGGAEWTEHWAYKPVVRPKVPEVGAQSKPGVQGEKPGNEHPALGTNPVDAFIRARLEREGIKPSPQADAYTICRRLYLDLTGLPPTPEEADDFARKFASGAQAAVESLADRLLASHHFGERWGRHWLDMARYADSDGYEKDRPRPDAWRYRDWVIEAVNRDMPFDQFTIEQLAGDLLPDATPEQKLATAFHRQTLTNTEGGVDQEQFRNEAVFDRTETTGAVWLGLTVGCARCHTHKYDQISQREYYQLFAFFNNGDETTTKVPTSSAELAEYEKKNAAHLAKLKRIGAKYEAARGALKERGATWEKETEARIRAAENAKPLVKPLDTSAVTGTAKATFTKLADGSWLAAGPQPKQDTYTITGRLPAGTISALKLEVIPDDSLPGKGPGRSSAGNFVLSEFRVLGSDGTEIPLHSPKADFEQAAYKVAGALDGKPETGWGIGGGTGKPHSATFHFAQPIDGTKAGGITVVLDQRYDKGEHAIGRFRLSAVIGETEESIAPVETRRLVRVGIEKWTHENWDVILDWLAQLDPETRAIRRELSAAEAGGPKAPFMDARVIQQRKTPRDTRIFHRGEFLSPTDPVQPGVLAVLPPLRARGPGLPDRLDVARWLVSRENPLTPRVTVNHIWSQIFGAGLVRSESDFGVRGEPPTHPELLDWLADEFMRTGWSRKKLIRLLVTSATYQQSAAHRPDLRDIDPLNLLLARQSRVRVEGEIVRDLHLAVSGLLSPKIGGPSVFPPMPPDVAALSYANNFKWTDSKGEDRYRRAMYTFFKRTAPHPDLMTFDCPDANTACLTRTVSDTPLQALAALNAEAFAEAARALATRVLREAPGHDAVRVERAFRLALARPPTGAETSRLMSLLSQARAYYAANPEEAQKLAGTAKHTNDTKPGEVAAWTAMTRIVMNTDEFITRN